MSARRTVAILAVAASAAAVAAGGCARVSPTQEARSVRAIAKLKALSAAQITYSSACGNGAYAVTFKTLLTPPPGTSEGFLGPDFTPTDSVEYSGYVFRIAPGADATPGGKDCNGTPTMTSFYASAVPLNSSLATRSFAINAAGAVWEVEGLAAPKEPFGPPARPVQ